MKLNILFLLFTPVILFSQQNKINIETIKEGYIQDTYGIRNYMGKPYNGVLYLNYKNGKLQWKENYKDGQLHGIAEEHYENGKLKHKMTYKDGQLHGLYETYYENGQLESKKTYREDKENGLYETYYENGQLEWKWNYKDGQLHGLYESYYENGKLEIKTTYREDKENGLYERYYENGQLELKWNYKDGELHGLYESYYENGKLSVKMTYKDGRANGLKVNYRENGQVDRKEWISYPKGEEKIYLVEQYYQNGQLKMISDYRGDNRFTSTLKRYYKSGKLKSKTTPKDDKIHKLYEKYYENGQLEKKLLYEIESGKLVLDYRSLIGDTNIKDVNIYDLEAMVRLFLKDCKLHNIKLSSDYKINSTFETLDKGLLALSYGIFKDSEIIIKVSPEQWSKASNPKRWYILYHELGHDVLNLQHGQGGKMMFNFTEKDYTWDEFFTDKEYMLNSISK